MTVPELRKECKRLGLPVYQHKGRRLRKSDLVKQLGENNGTQKYPRRGSTCGLAIGASTRVNRPTLENVETSGVTGKNICQAGLCSCGTVVVRKARKGDIYAIEPAPAKRRPAVRVPARRLTDRDRLIRQLAAMPTTPVEAMALYRMLNGTAKPGHNEILRRREGKACQILAERAKTDTGRMRWHERYLQTTGKVL